MDERYLKVFDKYGLFFGKCLGSKSGYRSRHPNHLIIFNARIYLKSYYEQEKEGDIRDFFKGQECEVWYGDLDLNKNIYDLWKIHLDIGKILVVTSEMGNKILEIGSSPNKTYIGFMYKEGKQKGISLEDIEKEEKNEN